MQDPVENPRVTYRKWHRNKAATANLASLHGATPAHFALPLPLPPLSTGQIRGNAATISCKLVSSLCHFAEPQSFSTITNRALDQSSSVSSAS
ncbi:unnamed protein product [Phytomonas sp. Hart1]|nr:unnamed protein product [Phytomonas sp. Hart1]|eukprot:CCW69687.1 unnamed protein product [Phytomonas sp. isolate Hart1]